MKIRYKLLSGYGAVLCLMSLCFAVVFAPILTKLTPTMSTLKQDVRELQEATTLLDLNSQIRLLRISQIKETLQFSLERDERSKNRYAVGQRRIRNALAEAIRQSIDVADEELFVRLIKLNQASERLEKNVFELRSAGNNVEARTVASGEEYSGVAQDFFDVIVEFEYRKKMVSADEFSVLVGITEFVVTGDRELRVAFWKSFWLIVASVIGSIVLAIATSHAIASRINKLTIAVRDVANGDMTARLEPDVLRSSDEIGALSRAFNQMSDELQSTTVSLTVLEEEVARRKRSEESRRASENQLRLITDNVQAMIAHLDSDQRYLFANDYYVKNIGLPREEIIGSCVKEVLGEAAYSAVQKNIERALAGHVVVFQSMLPLESGDDIWLDVTYIPEFSDSDSVRGIYVLCYNITELKRTEISLTHSEARLNAVLETAADAIITISDDKLITSFNPAAEKIFGYAAGEVIGKNVRLLVPQPHADLHDGYVESYLTTCVVKIIGSIRELMAVRKDGSVFPIELSVSERRWVGQRGFTGIVRDITERKRAEEELSDTRDKLIQEARLATIGKLVSTVSHELRNPLSSIGNAVFYLNRKVPESQPKWREYLAIIESEVRSSDRIISNLLEGTRAKEPIPQELDLGEMIEQLFGRRSIPGGVQCQFSSDPAPFIVRADETQLKQVFTNLLENSLQAMQAGGKVSVSASRDANGDIIVFRDTGSGIAVQHRKSIFDPLFSTKAKGTGLGLWISKQIVEQHDGSIELMNGHDVGASFRIRLPRSEHPS